MKKSMIALLVAAISISAMADVLIYDYAASFKRINVADKYVKVKYDDKTYSLDSAKVASDKVTGYVVIEACTACTREVITGDAYDGNYSGDGGEKGPGNYAVVYVTRKGGTKGAYYRAIGRFYAGMFGAKSGKSTTDNKLVNPLKFTDAYGFLSYAINANAAAGGDYGAMGKNQTGINSFDWFKDAPAAYKYAADFDTIDQAGYGKVQLVKSTKAQDCLEDKIQSCYAVKNLSGNILGAFVYSGHCSEFLMDVCAYVKPAYAKTAPINGTFTLKLNNKLSFNGKNVRNSTFKAAEDLIEQTIEHSKGSVVYNVTAEATDFNTKKTEALDTTVKELNPQAKPTE